jgi:hypothetical protein
MSLSDVSLLPLALICFAILLFFILREFFTWYWKQNEICDLLKKIEQNTKGSVSGKVEK